MTSPFTKHVTPEGVRSDDFIELELLTVGAARDRIIKFKEQGAELVAITCLDCAGLFFGELSMRHGYHVLSEIVYTENVLPRLRNKDKWTPTRERSWLCTQLKVDCVQLALERFELALRGWG